MLILGRKLNERIRLNDCRIGIEAPPAVEIVREELIGQDAPSR
jgi:sRNA-binding carbon storage regulator CsrA